MKKIVTVVAMLILLSTQCFALGESWVNQEVKATGKVHLRTSPPKGLFCSKGNKIAVVKKGEKVMVLEHVRITCALFFSYDFLKIERLGSEISKEKRYGYVAVIDDTTGRPLFTTEEN